jgi:hypothetical protein
VFRYGTFLSQHFDLRLCGTVWFSPRRSRRTRSEEEGREGGKFDLQLDRAFIIAGDWQWNKGGDMNGMQPGSRWRR